MTQDSDSKQAGERSVSMDKLVALCARRGFVFPSSEIYGGINGFWDYGPLGVELKNNLKALWWQRVVRERDDVVGVDSSIIAHPRTWEASGHVDHFSDPMVDCRACKKRFRADQLDDAGRCSSREGSSEHDFTEPRNFNLMLQTQIGASEDATTAAHLRPETCQSLFTDFKRVREASRQKIPFGIAQIGKAFRNEITPRNFTFRSREFEQAEMEFFCHPSEREKWFEYWRAERLQFHRDIGLRESHVRNRTHDEDELAHYARAAVDVDYRFPFDWQEIEGVHDRGDWDLSRHGEFSGKDLGVTDEVTKEHYNPVVIETSMGVDRTCLALLADAYHEESLEGGETRTVLHFHPAVAPVKAAVLPLSKKLAEGARRLEGDLRRHFNCFYDESGNIGRRYRRQDEAGTPFCLTWDFDSQEDGRVTVRERDSMEQERVPVEGIVAYLRERLEVGL
ncbi:MAG: glycine--tRNA ligase [Deltaproteobacteria bacterium]|nr:glycine--tRNA ligase [Deltaproteobacteria bacterium]